MFLKLKIHIYIYIYFALKLRNIKFANSFESIKIDIYEESIDKHKSLKYIYSSTTRMFPPIIHDNPTTERRSKSFPCFLCTWTEGEIRVDVIFLSVARIVFSAYHRTTIIRHPLDRFSALLQFVSIQLQLSLG